MNHPMYQPYFWNNQEHRNEAAQASAPHEEPATPDDQSQRATHKTGPREELDLSVTQPRSESFFALPSSRPQNESLPLPDPNSSPLRPIHPHLLQGLNAQFTLMHHHHRNPQLPYALTPQSLALMSTNGILPQSTPQPPPAVAGAWPDNQAMSVLPPYLYDLQKFRAATQGGNFTITPNGIPVPLPPVPALTPASMVHRPAPLGAPGPAPANDPPSTAESCSTDDVMPTLSPKPQQQPSAHTGAPSMLNPPVLSRQEPLLDLKSSSFNPTPNADVSSLTSSTSSLRANKSKLRPVPYSNPRKLILVPPPSSNLKTQSPVPLKTQSPVPLKTQSQVPLKTQSQVPLKTQSPVPLQTQSPVPRQQHLPQFEIPPPYFGPMQLQHPSGIPMQLQPPSGIPMQMQPPSGIPMQMQPPSGIPMQMPMPLPYSPLVLPPSFDPRFFVAGEHNFNFQPPGPHSNLAEHLDNMKRSLLQGHHNMGVDGGEQFMPGPIDRVFPFQGASIRNLEDQRSPMDLLRMEGRYEVQGNGHVTTPGKGRSNTPNQRDTTFFSTTSQDTRSASTAPSDDCSICMEPQRPGEKVVHLLCDHVFHFKCGYAWITSQQTCPMCRDDVTPFVVEALKVMA